MSTDFPQTRVAIVYYSDKGHTRVLADCIARGAGRVSGTEVSAMDIYEADKNWDVLHESDAIVFGTPTFIGSVAAEFKAFIEKLNGPIWLDRMWTGKIAAGFTVSAGRSGDKLNCLMQLVIFAGQMGMIWVNQPLLGGNYSTAGSEEDLNRMAGYLGVMAQANIDEDTSVVPPESDRRTAEIHGEHIAAVTRDLVWGRQLAGQSGLAGPKFGRTGLLDAPATT
ncbi:MAG: flavodoxin family protein [Alphaproteobacteria bacterium]